MIVADAGPIIALARAGLLELLPRLFDQIVLPPAALAEITRAPDKPGASEIRAAPWVRLEEERRARGEAGRLGIPLMGTLAVLEDAKRRNLIPSLAAALDRLRTSGFHLSPRLRDQVLQRVGGL